MKLELIFKKLAKSLVKSLKISKIVELASTNHPNRSKKAKSYWSTFPLCGKPKRVN